MSELFIYPTLKVSIVKQIQRRKEGVRVCLNVYKGTGANEPIPSQQIAISMFADKWHKAIAVALAGDHFNTLQEAMDKALIVEGKNMRIYMEPSFAFLHVIQLASKLNFWNNNQRSIQRK